MAATLEQVKALVSVPTGTITDEEITSVIQLEPHVYRAAASVCRKIASFYATGFDVSSGGQRASLSQRHIHFSNLARMFDKKQNGRVSPGQVTGTDAESAFTADTFTPDKMTA